MNLEKVLKRFHSKIFKDPESGCWIWVTGLSPNGYGRFHVMSGYAVFAHRWYYETVVGPLGSLVIDHLCRRKNCVNPDHLEPVTQSENSRRDREYRYPK